MCRYILQQEGKMGISFSLATAEQRVHEKDQEGWYLFGSSFSSMTLGDTCQPWDLYMKFVALN